MHSGHMHSSFGSLLCRFRYLMKSHSKFLSLNIELDVYQFQYSFWSVKVHSFTYGKVHACVQTFTLQASTGIKAHGLPPNLCPLLLLLISKSKKSTIILQGKSSDESLHPI